jgi:ABC-type hemin transport system substrate-binding protein
VNLVDDLGAPVPLRGSPRRVVSLVPSITETVAASAPELLAGVTDYCTHPPGLDAPRIGGSKYPNLQAVLALAPDLVLANAEENRREDVAALRQAGVPVWTTAAAATVPEALDSLRRMLVEALGADEPAWLPRAQAAWAGEPPIHSIAVVCVWRRPWIVLGRDTFAGDVLRRLGIGNAFAEHTERYPRPALAELTALLDSGAADLVVLPDEPYAFGPDDGPEVFPRARCALVSGRHLTWWGPSLVEAAQVLCERLPSGA